MSIQAFGPVATEWASRLPSTICAVVADPADPARALAAASALRQDGREYFTSIFLDDRRAAVAAVLATTILNQFPTLEMRRALFDQLAAESLTLDNNTSQRAMVAIDQRITVTLRDLYGLADAPLFRSWTEYMRIGTAFAWYRQAPSIFCPPDSRVPLPGKSADVARYAVVIWAPEVPAASVALLAFSVEELRMPCIVVCSDGAPQSLKASFVPASAGADALSRALVIVDASLTDPGTALALTAHGLPIASATTSGAHEHVTPAYLYEPWNWRSVFAAVCAALGGTPSRARSDRPGQSLEPSAARATGTPALAKHPLVSVVIPSYNRRQFLPATLQRYAKQRYPNIEVVVVNDGGEAIDDITAQHPFVRLINLPENTGTPNALNVGVEAAVGEYLFLSADDDDFPPDHIENFVYALERTAGSVAHCNIMMRHDERDPDGTTHASGYTLHWHSACDPSAALFTGEVVITGLFMRRSAFYAAGGYDRSLPAMRDMELIMSLSQRFAFAHVDKTTAFYSYRSDPSSYSFENRNEKIVASLESMYAKHPVSERPSIDEGRRQTLAYYRQFHATKPLYEPALRLDREPG